MQQKMLIFKKNVINTMIKTTKETFAHDTILAEMSFISNRYMRKTGLITSKKSDREEEEYLE